MILASCGAFGEHRMRKIVLVTLMLVSELAAAHNGSDGAAPVDEPPPNLRAKSLILAKVYCLIVVFWATILGGLSPYFLRWNSSFLVLGTQYAGGVFLATALIHFLSDSHDGFEELTTQDYAFAELLAMAGYLITMLGDFVIQRASLRVPPPPSPADEEKGTKLAEEKDRVSDNGCACVPEGKGVYKCAGHKDIPADAPEVKATLVHQASFGDALILILALCFHSVFEGIAIGVAETKLDAWKALWTISLHKVFAAIAMGIALLCMLPNRPLFSCFSYAFAFAISTPVGVAIGIIIDATTQGATADWVYAISMGLASGVFIYVAINHLLAKGYVPPSKTAVDEPLYKFIAIALGAATIAVVMIWDA